MACNFTITNNSKRIIINNKDFILYILNKENEEAYLSMISVQTKFTITHFYKCENAKLDKYQDKNV